VLYTPANPVMNTTLETYARGTELYIDSTPKEVSGFMRQWFDAFLSKIKPSSKILEIGSASGRDARYFADKGYAVQVSDATNEFVTYLHSHGFDNAIQLDIVEQQPPQQTYDLVFANAVFLHFDQQGFEVATKHVWNSLKMGGLFCLSLKLGKGSGLSTYKMHGERYFRYWSEADIIDFFQANRWRVVEYAVDLLTQPKASDTGWIVLTLQKE
jgi:2-polyprenyl-3-methyl-5-hydroxy-6-metoxy-1,4-benzoquinol methylase